MQLHGALKTQLAGKETPVPTGGEAGWVLEPVAKRTLNACNAPTADRVLVSHLVDSHFTD